MMIRILALLLALALPSGALGQFAKLPQQQQQMQQSAQSTDDDPRGAPYHTEQSDLSSVPLRDYLSSRIDQLRTEMFDRLDQLDRAQQKIIDERDQRYLQRFQAQQEAVGTALQAIEKRFESINEFRAQLGDQATTFMPKSEATVRFNALEEKLNVLTNRFDATQNVGEGRNDTWALIGALIAIALAAGAFFLNLNNRHKGGG